MACDIFVTRNKKRVMCRGPTTGPVLTTNTKVFGGNSFPGNLCNRLGSTGVADSPQVGSAKVCKGLQRFLPQTDSPKNLCILCKGFSGGRLTLRSRQSWRRQLAKAWGGRDSEQSHYPRSSHLVRPAVVAGTAGFLLFPTCPWVSGFGEYGGSWSLEVVWVLCGLELFWTPA